jgi:hypothetical protein
MLTNAIGGLQGMVDHALVGNLVGHAIFHTAGRSGPSMIDRS